MSLGVSGSATDPAWDIVLAASTLTTEMEQQGRPAAYGLDEQLQLAPLPVDHPDAVIAWGPGTGWTSRLPQDDPRSAFLDLYLPICGGTPAHPITVGHLGQSLDGFIATHSGDSQFVTGHDNLVHLHRMRTLCGVVIVGAGTVAADDPQLTTRFVPGANPLRVIFDPARRLAPTYRVFTDNLAPTWYVCARSRIDPGETLMGSASIVGVDGEGPDPDVAQVLHLLRARGFPRVFVEGGGVTVSAFLEANLLDRLHIAIAPLLIGDGRPAIRLSPHENLRDCRRPAYRVFLMGGDVLFDCELSVQAETADGAAAATTLTRAI
jgi:diaminohydroxyphosphoribosylaminopyrimidine deaminase/5-amino-6-(5-phosphoribosylamino)uracil reductase